GRVAKFFCFQYKVLVLQAEIIAAPAVAQLVGRCSVFLETGPVPDKSGDNERCVLRFGTVHLRKTFFPEAVHHIFRENAVITSGLGVLPGGRFLSGFDNGKNIVSGYFALRAVFAYASSCFDQFLKFHDRSSSLSAVIFLK